jgi:uncharacterized membrane protein YcaP (DUF421 family)
MGILIPDISVTEKVVRSIVVYGFLLVAFRLSGKRQLGQMTPFDLLLVRNGRVLRANLRCEALTRRDLRAALRHHGVIALHEIRDAFLEEDGHVSVVTRPPTDE